MHFFKLEFVEDNCSSVHLGQLHAMHPVFKVDPLWICEEMWSVLYFADFLNGTFNTTNAGMGANDHKW